MIDIGGKTIAEVFAEAAKRWPTNDFFVVPAAANRHYHPDGFSASFAEMATAIDQTAAVLRTGGYGPGHRVAVDLENRPEHVVVAFALATVGASMVPINPDLRPAEVGYILSDSAPQLAIAAPNRVDAISAAIEESGLAIELVVVDGTLDGVPVANERSSELVTPATEASVLYTSGTTGKPKGCLLSQRYELEIGDWYLNMGGRIDYREGQDRIYNPLPLFHVNSGLCSLFAAMLSGNAQVQPERFSASAWWRDIAATGATVGHYLGVVVPALLAAPPSDSDTQSTLRFAVGAGVEPSLHEVFEDRFGFPLIEVWGMTEMCRLLGDTEEPRSIHTRAIGRARPTVEVRVVDENDDDVPVGTTGEMVVRHSEATPRAGFFDGYLNKPEATAEGWRNGWWHTGDTVTMDETGMVEFVDRSKNIIRRSGENISAAEIEACLHEDDRVAQVAVLAIADPVRDEEVYACVVPRDAIEPSPELAEALFAHCAERMAYYKPPGWLLFVDDLPTTGTQKIMKHALFGADVDPTELDGVHDFRDRKKRQR